MEETAGMRSRTLSRAAVLAVAAAGALTVAPAAQAARLDDGAAKLSFNRQTIGAVKGAGVLVATILPAEASHLAATFPVTGGDINPATGRGFISHRGVLAFATGRGRRIVQMEQLRVSIGHSSSLSARIGKVRLTVAHLRGTPRTAHDADAAAIGGLRVELTPLAAKVLDRVLEVKVFRAGQRLGRLAIEAHLAQLVLTSGYTALTPDAGTVQALAAQ